MFVITGRPDEPEERAATIDNLKKVGYAGWKELVMRGVGDGCSTTGYKKHAPAAISANGFKIIANVGDQWSDLDPDPGSTDKGSFAERIFKVPNPFYLVP